MNAYILLITSLTLFYGGLILFYHFGWLNLGVWKNKSIKGTTKVTVIVPARNEEQHIRNCIQHILSQDYPIQLLEIIVVDDFSNDNTVGEIQKINSPNLHLIQLKDILKGENEIKSYKKLSIETAIKQASGELIITTDADCIMGSEWISTIVSFYETTGFQFIVSPVTFIDDKSFFEKTQSLDFLGLMGISGGSLAFNFPTMCNGANLAYTRQAFEEVGGFTDIDKIASGDDMMLMQKINKKHPGSIGYLKSREAIVSTYPQRTLKNFVQQRIRWISKSGHYPDKRITLVLALSYLFNLLLFWNGIFSIIDSRFLPVFLLQLCVKLVLEFFFLFAVTKFFRRQKLLILFLPAQLLHIIYVLVIGLLGNVMTYNWKGRKTR